MKTILIYKSKTGFTEKYAKWISEELKCEIASIKDIKRINFSKYDLIIFGSRIHAGMIDGFNKIRKLNLNDKLTIFVTGATPKETYAIKDMWKNNLSIEELKNIKHFYIPAGLNYEKMNLPDKTIMKLLHTVLSKKKNKTKEDIGMVNAISKSYDISNKTNIKPLINYIKSL